MRLPSGLKRQDETEKRQSSLKYYEKSISIFLFGQIFL